MRGRRFTRPTNSRQRSCAPNRDAWEAPSVSDETRPQSRPRRPSSWTRKKPIEVQAWPFLLCASITKLRFNNLSALPQFLQFSLIKDGLKGANKFELAEQKGGQRTTVGGRLMRNPGQGAQQGSQENKPGQPTQTRGQGGQRGDNKRASRRRGNFRNHAQDTENPAPSRVLWSRQS
jgi:hypothetical protein